MVYQEQTEAFNIISNKMSSLARGKGNKEGGFQVQQMAFVYTANHAQCKV
jgi:hypothetical protein